VVILPEHSWPDAAGLWRRAEELGFDHAWTYDHLAWRGLRDRPWFAAMPTLTAAATVTERIRLGPLVASPNFRHPVPFAKEVMTLDDVSRGRITLGLGAGGTGWDATILGQDPWTPAERAKRFTEMVECLDVMLREPAASYRGTHFVADEARTYPGCVQQPRVPFAIAATGPQGMRLAARHATAWVTTGDRTTAPPVDPAAGAAMIVEQIARLEEACGAVGRDPTTIDRLVLGGAQLDEGLASEQAFADTVGAYEAAGVTDLVVHWPRPAPPYQGDVETFEQVVTSVLRAD
jgi:alkanesulfonate monooxygenase SsuD/methylene tetrahydromethanopterin reductase-like flavin-dependent oxidoreductase (luciferase family)